MQGRGAGSCGSPAEPPLVVTGISRVSGVEEIFMRESDASNFLKKRDKRSPKSQDEVNSKDAGGLPSALASSPVPSLSHSQLGCGDRQGPRAQPRPLVIKVTEALN